MQSRAETLQSGQDAGKFAQYLLLKAIYEGKSPKSHQQEVPDLAEDGPRRLAPEPSSPAAMDKLILGEASRTIDQRFRLSVPPELVEALAAEDGRCFLAKELPGCLSLWDTATWQARLDEGVELVRSKILARRLDGRLEDVQRLGRMLSTRHTEVQLAGRGRLVVPDGFREFLGVEPGGEVMVVGAAVCVELWHPERWSEYIQQEMPAFRQLIDQLVG